MKHLTTTSSAAHAATSPPRRHEPRTGSWIVLVQEAGRTRAVGRVINATAESAEATAHAFFDWIVGTECALRVIPETEASARARFEANAATLLPVLESLRP